MRKLTPEARRVVFDATAGRCHLCKNPLALKHYGAKHFGKPTAWELDHQRPRAKGGSDHGNNLRAACISCNRSRQTKSAARVREQNGFAKPPVSADKRSDNMFIAGVVGAVGAAAFGATLGPALLVGSMLAAIAGED
jgi:5-methylcytosine-specific restriction endonuclease McrA